MLNVEVDTSVIEDLRLTERELKVAQQRAIGGSVRKLRTIGRRSVRRRIGLPARSANRRVLAFPRRGKVWLGANRVNPLSLSGSKLGSPWRHRRYRKGSVRWGAVYYRGRRLPGAFAQRDRTYSKRGKYIKNIPFRRRGRSLEVVTEDIAGEMQAAYNEVRAAAPQVIDREFRANAERVVRGRQ